MAEACATCGATDCGGACAAFTDPDDVVGGLTDALIPVVDAARDLYAQLGSRAYHVLLVRTRWTGGERGVGVEQVVAEAQVLPIPLVADMTALVARLQAVGVEEVGDVRLTEVSGRYTENDLSGLGPSGEPIPDDEQFYWELHDAEATAAESPRRRFVLARAPSYDATRFEWTVVLRRVAGDRTRAGDPG